MIESNILFTKAVEATHLVNNYPADWYNEHKQKLFKLTALEKDVPDGTLLISRYCALPLPSTLHDEDMKIIATDKIFDYTNIQKEYKSWHVNFADGDLFNYYGSALLAQDELQVMEHPILANVLEYLRHLSKKSSKFDPNTRDYDVNPNPPTPILIEGVERRIDLNTLPSVHNSNGLYGNNFSKADWNAIESEVHILKPCIKSNIIAMEAYPGGSGNYTLEQIEDIFITAYTAFSAAKYQTADSIEIHTGDWGTGAYGGNKVLTACLQLLAANAVNIDLLVFHTFDMYSFEKAKSLYVSLSKPAGVKITDILAELEKKKFQWGFSDGN